MHSNRGGFVKERSIKKTILQLAMLAALMFVTYYLIMKDKDVGDIWRVMVNTSKIWLLVALASMTLYIFCGGWAIRVLMKGLGRKVTIWQCFKYSFVEFYFSALTPSSSGGQPVQLVYMAQDGFPTSDSSVVLITITALYKFSFLALSAVLFILNFNFISGPIKDVLPLVIIGLVLNLGLIAILVLLLFSKKLIRFLVMKVTSLLGKLHLVKDPEEKKKKLESTVANYNQSAKFILAHKGLVVRTFGVLTLQRLAILFITYFVYKSFNLTGFTMLQILATQCLLNLCVDMMPLPGAVGISETVFLMLFTPIFLEQNVTTAVLLSRGISFYVVVVVAAIVIMGIQVAKIVRTNKKSKEQEIEGKTIGTEET